MFILFFGTRAGKKKEKPLPEVPCPFCGQKGTLHATLVPYYVHLFWIPVWSLRPLARVDCSHCRKAYEGESLTPEMRRGLEALREA
jgi:hypothetical protein